jgi:muconate cycloisomerase
VSILSQLDAAVIEYVEEPLRAPSRDPLYRLRSRSAVPLALDESLRDVADVQSYAGAFDVAVLKAPRVGGPYALMAMAAAAADAGLAVTITDSLESCVGRALALHTACALGLNDRAMGLAGAALLRDDVCSQTDLYRGVRIAPEGPGLFDLALLDGLDLNAAFARGASL